MKDELETTHGQSYNSEKQKGFLNKLSFSIISFSTFLITC